MVSCTFGAREILMVLLKNRGSTALKVDEPHI